MFTAGDIEFEHPEPKILPLAPRIVVLFAGDVTAHLAIYSTARAEISRSGVTDVALAAEIVGEAYRAYRGRVAERTILAPLGLTMDSFVAHQRTWPPSVATRVTRAVSEQSAGVETIVAGMDERGGHVFLIADPGQVVCYDGIGFAAIGGGSRHAPSLLLQRGYTPRMPFARAAVLVYVAKKRSEVAPGVGSTTDGFGIGDRYYLPASDELSGRLAAIYQTHQGRRRGGPGVGDRRVRRVRGSAAGQPEGRACRRGGRGRGRSGRAFRRGRRPRWPLRRTGDRGWTRRPRIDRPAGRAAAALRRRPGAG